MTRLHNHQWLFDIDAPPGPVGPNYTDAPHQVSIRVRGGNPLNTAIILWLQSFHSPLLDFVFKTITQLGGEAFYTITIPIVYWCVNKQFAFSLGTVFLFSNWINTGIKDLIRIPRPSHDVVRVIDTAGGYSFPSGHAQGTSTFFAYLALKIKRRWFTFVAMAAIVLVSLSRPYLGVHYPTDVVAGAIIGTLIALAIYALGGERLRIPVWAFVAVPLLMLMVDQTPDSAKAAGFLAGFGIGNDLDRRYLDFHERGALKQQVIKTVLGLAVLLGLRAGLKAILPISIWSDFIRYAGIGVVGTYFLPWIFTMAGLAGRGKGAGPT